MEKKTKLNDIKHTIRFAQDEPWDWDMPKEGLYIPEDKYKLPKREKYFIDKALVEINAKLK